MSTQDKDLPLNLATISLLVHNLHCPSCVESITQILSPLPAVQNLSVSLLLHRVTFAVDISPSSLTTPKTVNKVVQEVKARLAEEGGFKIADINVDHKHAPRSRSGGSLGRQWWEKLFGRTKKQEEDKQDALKRQRHLGHCPACRAEQMASQKPELPTTSSNASTGQDTTMTTVLSVGGMTCASCTASITSALLSNPSILSADVTLLSSSAKVRHTATLPASDMIKLIEAAGYEAEVVSASPDQTTNLENTVKEPPESGLTRTTLSIAGMTCASCTSSIDSALQERADVKEVAVDLLGNRSVVIHASSLSPLAVQEIVDELGYKAEIVGSEPVVLRADDKGKRKEKRNSRTISIRIRGVSCIDCITLLNAHLSTLPLESYTQFTLSSPVTTMSYEPHQPLTIRDILDSLSGLAPDFEAEVVKAQSLYERSQVIQRHEFRLLAYHLAVAVVLAIPTFIIAIVGMIILRSDSWFRTTWMTPVWGAANRGTLVLWAVATVVQFGIGWLFHRRALTPLWFTLRSFIRPLRRSGVSQHRPRRSITWRSFVSYGSMDLLVSLSTNISYFASIAMLIIDVRANGDRSIGTYFDTSVFLIMFILLGRTLEAYAKSRTTDAVALLGALRPETALLVDNPGSVIPEKGGESTSLSGEGVTGDGGGLPATASVTPRLIPVDLVERGDHLLIQPGSLPPTDGIIISGSTTFDESSLTGESKPVHKQPGDEVFTGTVNHTSAITIRVTSVATETMLEHIINAVADANGKKAPIEKLAERFTGVFVPVIIYLALAVLAIWLVLSLGGKLSPSDYEGKGGKVFFAIEFAISCLVVACPCGIGLAVPCANAVGNGIAAAAGILASGGGEAFTAATTLTTIAFDKTGTLTIGKSVVTDEQIVEETLVGRSAFLRAVKEVEVQSTHPMAVGLVEYLTPVAVDGQERVTLVDSAEIAGRGMRATVQIGDDSHDILIGNVALMREHDVPLSPEHSMTLGNWSNQAKSVVLVSTRVVGGAFALAAMFSLSDPPRETTPTVLAKLRKMGYRLVMLSGDNVATASAMARIVGIDEQDVYAGVKPEGKAEVICQLQAQRGEAGNIKRPGFFDRLFRPRKLTRDVVMFVGDGINDSVALAAADVSVAMGHGSQATLASADFVLLNSSLDTLLPLLRISRKVHRRQRFNLFWAMVFNIVCLPFAGGAFFPLHGVRLTPVWSAVLMALSSVSVVCSSLALRWGL